MKFKFYIIDAFTQQRFEGAQIAVFPQAQSLNSEQMQKIAKEMNLTESVFILDAKQTSSLAALRIFSPSNEVFQTGHTIIAAVFAMHLNGQIKKQEFYLDIVDQQLSIELDSVDSINTIYYSCPQQTVLDSYVPAAKELAHFLNLNENDIDPQYPAMLASCIEDYLIVPVKNEQNLLDARFIENKWTMSFVATLANKILLFSRSSSGQADFIGRLLGIKINEHDDPPIGPAAPAFGNYLLQQQTTAINITLQRGGFGTRKSLIQIQADHSTASIKVGGSAVLTAEGDMLI